MAIAWEEEAESDVDRLGEDFQGLSQADMVRDSRGHQRAASWEAKLLSHPPLAMTDGPQRRTVCPGQEGWVRSLALGRPL